MSDAFHRFLTALRHQEADPLPRVTLTYAQSLDGSIAKDRGAPLILSSSESLAMTHRLRAAHDAILVGIGTVLADDPQLTVRLADGTDPQPVVLDSHLRIPEHCRLMDADLRPWLATVEGNGHRARTLEARGAQVLSLPADDRGRIDLPALLEALRHRGIHRLMVEGGASVITSFLRSGLVDWVVLTIVPRLVGGLRAVEGPLAADGLAAPRLLEPDWQRFGSDLVMWGRLETAVGPEPDSGD